MIKKHVFYPEITGYQIKVRQKWNISCFDSGGFSIFYRMGYFKLMWRAGKDPRKINYPAKASNVSQDSSFFQIKLNGKSIYNYLKPKLSLYGNLI